MVKFDLVDKKGIVDQLRKLVWQAAKEFDKDLKLEDVQIEHPENPSHGDYSANIAMAMFAKIKNAVPAGRQEKLKTKNDKEKLKIKRLGSPLELASVIAQLIARLIEKERELTPNQNSQGSYGSGRESANTKRRELKFANTIANTIEKVEVAPPGFINFWLSKEWLLSQIDKIIEEKEKFGCLNTLKGKKIMVEFAHPNTHKPFHIGHLRNICLGESLVRILEANGAKVIRTNYQGDIGLHIAKALWAFAKLKTKNEKLKTLDEKIEFLGKAYAAGNRAYEEDEKAKQEIIEINSQIYNQDPKIMPLWQKTRQWSLDYFDRIYKRVYSRFDRLYFESEMLEGKEIAEKAVEKGILKKSQGAIIFDGERYGLDTRVFVTALGHPTYEAKELKLAQLEFSQFGQLDKCIHVVGPEQTSFFKVTFKVEELLDPGKFKDKQYHLVYGWVRLKKGKMSSRAGQVVLAEWLIDEVKKRLIKEFKMEDQAAEVAAVGAVKYSFLKFSPSKEIAFDIEESINMEGDSGPYLQYTYARAQSVLRKAQMEALLPDRPLGTIPDRNRFTPRVNREELAVLRTIYKFPEVVKEAGESYAPNLICNFLFDLAQKFNGFYNKHRILHENTRTDNKKQITKNKKQGNEIRDFRLVLTAAAAQVLKNGLELLSIKTLEKM